MRGNLVRLAALALSLCAPVIAAAGQIIYEQPSVTPTVLASTSQYFPDAGQFGFNVFDDFTLIADVSITDVHWRGQYFNTQADPAEVPSANASGFGIGFYSDNSGSPGSQLASFFFTPAQANETFVGSEVVGAGQNSIYDYWVDLPSAFDALANETYWLRIVAYSPLPSATEAQWGWGRGSSGGTALQYNGFDPNYLVERDDRAFALSTTVPEPSSLILLSTMLLGVAAVGRKRAQRS